MEIRKILFPVDLTGFSSKIVPQVKFMARNFNAEIHLLYVVGSLEKYSTFFVPHPSLDQMEKESVQRAEGKLDEFAKEFFYGFPRITTAVMLGNPVEQIERYVESAGIDLIIMATHGRHGLERALFGSIADEVVRSTFIPVMCINVSIEEERWKVPGEVAHSRIVPSEPDQLGARQ